MTIKTQIEGNSGFIADVTKQGSLKIIPQEFNEINKQTIIDANAVNFFKPRAGKHFIMSGIIVNTDRKVGVNGALVDIYESDTEDGTTIAKSIISIDLPQNTTAPILNIFTETSEGVFINGKANDFDVNVSVLGFFVNV